MEQTQPSLRETLESAFDEHDQAGGSAADTQESVRPAAEDAQEERPAADTSRDERGRFKAKSGGELAAPESGDAGAGEAQARPAEPVQATAEENDPLAKAPQSWKPGAREAWSQLSPDVRAEVYRREREAQQVLQETAQARQVYQHLGGLQQKFGAALAAEGVNVLQATENLMGVAARLRLGTPLEKAQTAAAIIQQYGVDLVALDHLLSNQPMPAQPQMMQADPRVDQLFQRLEQAQRQRVEQAEQKAVQEVEQFGTNREFFEDVREDMADLLEVAAKRGLDLTLEAAYDRACQLNPEISKVLAARAAAKSAGTAQQSTQRAKAAASSVRGTPSGVPSSGPMSLRETIEQAMESGSGR